MATEISKQFQRRCGFLLQAAHILIENVISESDKTEFDRAKKSFLHADAEGIYQHFNQSIELVSDFKDGLDLCYDLLKQFIDFLEGELFLDKKVLYKAICQAEQLAVWQKGRSELITESKYSHMNIRQIDVPMLKLADSQKSEYLGILHNDAPSWYLSLSNWQRRFLKKQLNAIEGADIEKYLFTIPAGLQQVPGLSNYSLHALQLQTEKNELLLDSYRFCCAFPSVLFLSDKAERQRLIKQNINQIFEQPLKEIGKRFLMNWNPVVESGQLLNVPVLVQSLLSPVWSDNLFGFLKKAPTESRMIHDKEFAIRVVKDKLESKRGVTGIRHLKTNYRFNPIIISTNYPINALRKETLLIKNRMTHNSYNGVLLVYCVSNFIRDVILPKLTAGIRAEKEKGPDARQTDFKWMLKRMKKSLIETGEKLAGQNSDNTKPPVKQRGYHADLFKKLILKTLNRIIRRNSLFLMLTPAIKVLDWRLRVFKKELDECLNALNMVRLKQVMPEDAAFLEARLTGAQIKDLQLVLNAVRDYVVLYNTTRRFGRHKEMFLSCLEEIITEKIGGISCSASVMSRNRKGMQTLHTDAMLIYYQQFGVLPLYTDSSVNRKRFVDIFADLFLSEHQQKHAGQNMPGSEGIKDITFFPFYNGLYMIPKDILQEIRFRDSKAIKRGIQFANLSVLANPYSITSNLFRRVTDWFGRLYQVMG